MTQGRPFRWSSFLIPLLVAGFALGWARGQTESRSFPLGPPSISSSEPRKLAPNVPTPMNIVEQMLELSELKAGETLYDLGCGDGRILIMAAEKFQARAVGVELNENLYQEALGNVKAKGLEDRVRIVQGDLLEINLRPANVVTLYLLTSANEKIRPRMEKSLRNGSRVVSHDFKIPGWKPETMRSIVDHNGISHSLYLYKMPQGAQ